MKYKISLFYVCICFLIEISPIKSEEKAIRITLKPNGIKEKEYQLINRQFINNIKEIKLNNQNFETINSKLNLTIKNYQENTIDLIFNRSNINCSEMFKNCEDIESIDFLNYDMSSISVYNKMFEGCKSLKSIDLSFLKNAKVENINNMFSGCSDLKSLDWSHLDLSSVHTIENIFKDCINLESINFSYVNLENTQSLKNLFSDLTSLQSIDLSNINIPNLSNVESMFSNCQSLTSIDLSFINNSNIAVMSNMFNGCKFQTIDLSNYHLLSTSSIDMSNMFSNCTFLKNANLSNLYVKNSKNFKMNNLFSNCKGLLYADLSNVLIPGEIQMKQMFSECSQLTSVDFSNFNSNQNKDLDGIFNKCISLESIDLSTLKKITNLANSFMECTNLKSITFPDLNNVQSMANTFYKCDALISLDFSNINFGSLVSLEGMFNSCVSLITVNFENSQLNSVNNMCQMFSNCESLMSVNFKNAKKNGFINMYQMFYQCDTLISLNLSDFKSNNITELFYKCSALEKIDLSNFQTLTITNMEQVFYDCSSLISLNLSSFVTSSVVNMKGMFSGCSSLSSLNLSNFNFQSVTNVENMFNGCSELEYVNIYDISDINEPQSMFEGVKDNLVFCINENKAQNISKFLKSKSCRMLSCLENYKDNKLKIIMKEGNNKTCIDECYKEGTYIYELNNECYKECPEDYFTNKNTYKCEKECELIINFITKNDKECVYLFNSSSFYLGHYELINSNNKLKLYIADETINDINNGTLNFLLVNVTNEVKADYIVREENEIYQITSSYNQNNKEYSNISILHLGECEKILKDYYQIKENETLIIFKIDVFVEKLNIPIIKYEIFHPNNKTKLELNLCKSIQTIVPVSIDENKLFKYDPESDYYNDICFPYTTEKGTDIVLKDRKNEYNNKNLALCEKNCKMIEYNITSKNVICECDPQNRSPLQLDEIIDKERLLNNFIDIKSISNINILKCYENLFSKGGLINNVGNYIILSIVLIYAVSLLLFIMKGYNLLLDKIKTIMKNKRLEKNHIKTNNEIEHEKEKKNEKEKEKEKGIDEKLIAKNPPKKKVIVKKKKKTIEKEKVSHNLIISNSSIIKIEKSNEIIKLNEKHENENEHRKDLSRINSNNNKSREEQKTDDFSTYDDYELNDFTYKEASNKDKRTFFQLLISLIKTKHLIIFTFYQTNDYNSQIMKICLFFFLFALYYIVNALFFNDETMHKIYEEEGIFNFIYFIPQIIYSLIITSIINILIKELSLSEKTILKIKQEKDFEKLNELIPKVIKCLIIKFILFFLFSFLFLGFFWYYISCFGAVYKNTQIILLNDTLISFAISLVYPFIFYLLIALIRYPTLNKKEKCLNIWYKISKCIT